MAQARRPKSVCVLGQDFSIEYKPKVVVGDNDECYGLTHVKDFTIQISSTENKTPEQMEATLLHEVIHAVLGVSGLTELIDDKTEEALVVSLENGLKELYKRNF